MRIATAEISSCQKYFDYAPFEMPPASKKTAEESEEKSKNADNIFSEAKKERNCISPSIHNTKAEEPEGNQIKELKRPRRKAASTKLNEYIDG